MDLLPATNDNSMRRHDWVIKSAGACLWLTLYNEQLVMYKRRHLLFRTTFEMKSFDIREVF